MIPEIAFSHMGSRIQEKNRIYKERLPGDRLAFNLLSIRPDGEVISVPQETVIEKQVGDGFVGKVLLLEDKPYVLKTTTPGAFHHDLRLTASGLRQHPAERNERYIQALSVGMRIMHAAVPKLSEEIIGVRVDTPDSYGYTRLPHGLALAVERVRGRGPRFDLPTDEAGDLLEVRRKLLNLGTALGLEQVGQIHPDNPLGQPNIWITDKGYMWVDAVAAFPMKGNVLGIPFGFHKDMKKRLDENAPFNRIHTDRFQAVIEQYRHLFSEREFNSLQEDLVLYKRLDEELQVTPQAKRDPQAFVSADIKVAKKIGGAIATLPVKLGYSGYDQVKTTSQNIFSSKARHRNINRQVLQGTRKAGREGLLTDSEVATISASIENNQNLPVDVQRQIKVLERLFPAHLLTTMSGKILEGYTYLAPLAFDSDPKLAVFGALGGRIIPRLIRGGSTLAVGILTKTEYKTALAVSIVPVPVIGGIKAVPLQIAVLKGGSEEIIHWNARDVNARVSYLLSPIAGGLGSDADRRMWPHVGKRVEKFLKWLGKTEKNYNNQALPESSTARVQE